MHRNARLEINFRDAAAAAKCVGAAGGIPMAVGAPQLETRVTVKHAAHHGDFVTRVAAVLAQLARDRPELGRAPVEHHVGRRWVCACACACA